MSFVRSAESLRSRLGLTHFPLPVLAGAIVLAIVACLGVGFGFASFFHKTSSLTLESEPQEGLLEVTEGEGSALSAGEQGESGLDAAADEAVASFIKVHVAGCVRTPGVYELSSESRVQDAVDAAGGLNAKAAGSAVNLARKLVDGEQVYIPSKKEASGNAGGVSLGEGVSAGTASASSQGFSGSSSGLININTADLAALEELPGVGPATAQAIVEEREANGPFASPEDIQRVSGIGEKKYQSMKDLICV